MTEEEKQNGYLSETVQIPKVHFNLSSASADMR